MEHSEHTFFDVFYQAGENPVFCYRTGLTVYEDALVNGSFVSFGWNAAGYPLNVLTNCPTRLDPKRFGEPFAFNLEINGACIDLKEAIGLVVESLDNSSLKGVTISLAGGTALRSTLLTGKIGSGFDAGIPTYYDHLTVFHIVVGEVHLLGTEDAVFFVGGVAGESVPHAIDGAGIEVGVLLVPVDFLEDHLVAQIAKDGLGQLRIKSDELVVVIKIIHGRVDGVAHHYGLLFCFGATCKARQEHQGGQYDCKKLFHDFLSFRGFGGADVFLMHLLYFTSLKL